MNTLERKRTIRIEVDLNSLCSLTDDYLAHLWHVGQANPADYGDAEACEFVQSVGYEIIRRWLKDQGPGLYTHQADSHYHKILCDHGSWINGDWTPTPANKKEDEKNAG